MKLATGLWVWVSLLVAAGTVQPSASQSAGSLLVAPIVQDVGDPKPESGETLLSGSGPPEGRSLREALPARGRGRTGVPRRWQLGSAERKGCGESGSERAGFAPACIARGRCALGRPSLRGQSRPEPSLGAGARREDAPRPGGPQR
ncbi:hypothetical protein J1605_013176 [Eschrichtius robustus]|uniref:Uncharacterized protein n=1 Tax=Eschrichtius robustus TaxID=9764 RepID=A0AB34GIS4_ESCRO|nr:hypothetical protein J1605_013176 [Eschrichtius robustus]